MSEPILKVQGLGKCFKIYKQQRTLFRLSQSLLTKNPIKEKLWALKDIQFEIYSGEKLALIGANGAGKTTLLRLLSNILSPTEGQIIGSKRPHPLFKYAVGLDPVLPVIDNVFLLGAFHGLSVEQVKRKMDKIIEFAGLEAFLYVPVRKLSTGQMQRLFFSVFIRSNQTFMAFDESTSAADILFKRRVNAYFKRLMSSDKTMIVSSHDLEFLKKHCHRAIWLERGKIRDIGSCEEVIKGYELHADNN